MEKNLDDLSAGLTVMQMDAATAQLLVLLMVTSLGWLSAQLMAKN